MDAYPLRSPTAALYNHSVNDIPINITEPDQCLQKSDGLLVVDVQRDFCPGGALEVPEGDAIIPIINDWARAAHQMGLPIVASRDWHPEGHASFEEQGGKWPPHCVRETPGAEFHPALNLPESTEIISKGRDPDHDEYSPFDPTELHEKLRRQGVTRLWIAGLALDVCVRQSALDAAKHNLNPHLLAPATRAVDPDSAERTLDELRNAGVTIARQVL